MLLLGGDESMDELLTRSLECYCEPLNIIYVFSAEDGAELTARGIGAERIKRVPLEAGLAGYPLPRPVQSVAVEAAAIQALHTDACTATSPLTQAVWAGKTTRMMLLPPGCLFNTPPES